MIASLVYLLLAAVLCGCAIGVVSARNLVHAVFWLAGNLVVTAVYYAALEAPFLAGIQLVLYTGGVITLMLFGVMLTQRQANDTKVPNPSHGRPRQIAAGLTSGFLLGFLLLAIWGSPELRLLAPMDGGQARDVGAAFLGPHLLAFEVLSILLLAAMIGAIVLTRRSDP